MTQSKSSVEVLELDTLTVDSNGLIFMDDASYEFVGGGDAVNGY